MRPGRGTVGLLTAALVGLWLPVPAAVGASRAPGSVHVVSALANGHPARFHSDAPSINGTGRYVAFQSNASFGRADDNHVGDVYLADRRHGTRLLVSRSAAGPVGNAVSDNPAISATGRYVAYDSAATNLVPGGVPGIYRFDRQTGTTVLVAPDGVWPSISDSGRYVAFNRGGGLVYLTDLETGEETLVSHAFDDPEEPVHESWAPRISGNGRYVAFFSYDDDIVDGALDHNDVRDAFRYDRLTGTSVLISSTSSGESAAGASDSPSLSADGRYAAFWSMAPGLVPGVGRSSGQILVKDLVDDTTDLVSIGAGGAPGNEMSLYPQISRDGTSVAFLSGASNLVGGARTRTMDSFVRHLDAGVTELASHDAEGDGANAPSTAAVPSNGGRVVAFSTDATDLFHPRQAKPHRQVFVYLSARS